MRRYSGFRSSSRTNMRSSRANITRLAVRKVTAIFMVAIGLCLSMPFAHMIYYKYIIHQVTWEVVLVLISLLIGGPIFMLGLVLLLTNGRSISSDTSAIDLARIRHAVETKGASNDFRK